MNTINLVEVVGQGLYTFRAYCELRLQMSSGDYGAHKHSIITADASLEYQDIDEDGEFYIVNDTSEEINHV